MGDSLQNWNIKAIFFDFSGVVKMSPGQRKKAILTVAKRQYGISRQKLVAELLKLGYSESLMTPSDLQLVLESRVLPNLIGARAGPLSANFVPDETVQSSNVSLLQSLRGHYKTAIIANSNGYVNSRLTRLGIRTLFDDVIDSAIVGFRKPHPEIYLYAASRLQVQPEECLFIDNKPENIAGAEAVGMHALLYTAEEGESASLRELLVQSGLYISN